MTQTFPKNVYVIGASAGPLKIGVSGNPIGRAANLSSARKQKLRVIEWRSRLSGDARLVERAAHTLLAEKRLKGEWFDVPLDEAVAALDRAVAMVDAGEVKPSPRWPSQEGVVGVRLEEAERAALEAASAWAGLSKAALARKIVAEWLRAEGA